MVLIFLICFATDNRPLPIAALGPQAVECAIKLQKREGKIVRIMQKNAPIIDYYYNLRESASSEESMMNPNYFYERTAKYFGIDSCQVKRLIKWQERDNEPCFPLHFCEKLAG